MPVLLRPIFALGLLLALPGCHREPDPAPGAERPAQALQLLAERLRANDPAGFAIVAIPPDLHARVEAGWRAGRTRWPLDELPLDRRLPSLLATLSAPDAAAGLQAAFDRQFAKSGSELHSAAVSLGLFGTEYLRNREDVSTAEREHSLQVVQALSRWGATAPLDDRRRARQAIGLLTAAARRTGIDGEDDFARLGMPDSLARLGPFLGAFKQALKPYGLDLDASLASIEADLVEQTGDTARVRLRYTLGRDAIDTMVPMRRIEGRWYLTGLLRGAETSLQPHAVPGASVVRRAAVRPGSGLP